MFEAAVEDAPCFRAEHPRGSSFTVPVVVEAPAAEGLDAAVTANVVGGAEARRELVREVEVERVLLVFGAETSAPSRLRVRSPRFSVSRLPTVQLILNVERLDVVARAVRRAPWITAVDPIPVTNHARGKTRSASPPSARKPATKGALQFAGGCRLSCGFLRQPERPVQKTRGPKPPRLSFVAFRPVPEECWLELELDREVAAGAVLEQVLLPEARIVARWRRPASRGSARCSRSPASGPCRTGRCTTTPRSGMIPPLFRKLKMCRVVFWLNRLSTFSSSRSCLPPIDEARARGAGPCGVSIGVRPRSPRPFGDQVGRVRRGDVGRDRRAAAAVEERANLRAEREVVGAVQLHHVRTIRRQAARHVEVAVRVPEQLVDVPRAVDVAAGRAMLPACCCAVADDAARGRRGDSRPTTRDPSSCHTAGSACSCALKNQLSEKRRL